MTSGKLGSGVEIVLPSGPEARWLQFMYLSDCCLTAWCNSELRNCLVSTNMGLWSDWTDHMLGYGHVLTCSMSLRPELTAECLQPCASYLVDPASSHMLVSKIKPCMSQLKLTYSEAANGSLKQL